MILNCNEINMILTQYGGFDANKVEIHEIYLHDQNITMIQKLLVKFSLDLVKTPVRLVHRQQDQRYFT